MRVFWTRNLLICMTRGHGGSKLSLRVDSLVNQSGMQANIGLEKLTYRLRRLLQVSESRKRGCIHPIYTDIQLIYTKTEIGLNPKMATNLAQKGGP
uniref:Uncharacterized protein n=1 Tax=Solanum tuberosum TaxID=4113 RepID=M1CW85_SOLTU